MVCATSADNYLSSARKLIQDNRQSVEFMQDNPVLRAVRRGLKNEWVAIPGHSKAETTLYCVTIDMIEEGKKELLDTNNSLKDLGVYTEQVLSYGHINRTSELI